MLSAAFGAGLVVVQLRSERPAAGPYRTSANHFEYIDREISARESRKREHSIRDIHTHAWVTYSRTVGHRQLITRTAVNGHSCHRAGCARLWRKRAESAVAGLRGTSGSIVSARDLRPANRWPRACWHQRATNEGRENNARAALGSAAAGSNRSQHHLPWVLS